MELLNNIEIMGILGNLGFLIGAIYLAKIKKIGWLWQAYGNSMYIIYAINKSAYSLFALDFMLLIVNIIGYLKWRKLK